MRQHWPALDGLRAVAVLAVLIYHLWAMGPVGSPDLLPSGFLGVDVFFVLSGFLITTLLLGEWDERGQHISFRDFYARRVLRLYPALACVIGLAALLAGLMGVAGIGGPLYVQATLHGLALVVLFLGNWSRALSPGGFTLGPTDLGLLGHTWSLAIEEQFYLLWPPIFVLLGRRGIARQRIALWLTIAAAGAMIYHDLTYDLLIYSHTRANFGTDTHCAGLLMGCAMAFWRAGDLPAQHAGRAAVKKTAVGRTTVAVAMVVLIALFLYQGTASPVSLAVLATGVALIGLTEGRAPAVAGRVLSNRSAVWIGRRSYGLYLWHYPIFMMWPIYGSLLRWVYPGLPAAIAAWLLDTVVIALAFAAAAVSYRFIELPALRLKRRFRGPSAAIPSQLDATSIGQDRSIQSRAG